ncbi:WW domain binding protein 1-like b isoform X2 [Cyprinodon tularosa]|uniref:WW domain binding protein 1-like isoform X2 n=1 Tax=Cyprinodon variegatus TaxID=28743 RepID=UPI000742776D|nr:PREDICTED: WW domain binding protein 1-like isoform X2 [Cyprinodon variegatus]XP_038140680.1 WW domain binding protein 1-like b isoform X2 [Cyprinodon tularosa]
MSLIHCEGVNNHSYFCEYGHCCGESQCCSYYYELWWFWLVWAIIFILCFCCICHHRRTKHRMQQQQRQHEINLIAYREAHNFPSVPFYFRFLPNYLLPDYEEVVNRPPTPPPPYTALNANPSSAASVSMAPEQQAGHCPSIQVSPLPPVSEGLCSRPAMEEPQPPTFDLRAKPDNKPVQTAHEPSIILLSDRLNVETLTSQEKKTGSGEDSCKDPLLKDFPLSEGCTDDKERLPNGRRRRFTGDSGIEVCVCGTRGGSGCGGAGGAVQDNKERESLLGRSAGNGNEEEDAGDFCDSCGHRASLSLEEDQAPGGPERRAGHGLAGNPQIPQNVSSGSLSPPVCLLLHTISEQEGPAHSSDPQG